MRWKRTAKQWASSSKAQDRSQSTKEKNAKQSTTAKKNGKASTTIKMCKICVYLLHAIDQLVVSCRCDDDVKTRRLSHRVIWVWDDVVSFADEKRFIRQMCVLLSHSAHHTQFLRRRFARAFFYWIFLARNFWISCHRHAARARFGIQRSTKKMLRFFYYFLFTLLSSANKENEKSKQKKERRTMKTVDGNDAQQMLNHNNNNNKKTTLSFHWIAATEHSVYTQWYMCALHMITIVYTFRFSFEVALHVIGYRFTVDIRAHSFLSHFFSLSLSLPLETSIR